MSRALQRWVLLIALSTAGIYYVYHLKSLDGSLSGYLPSGQPHHVDWAKLPQKYPLTTYTQLPQPSLHSKPLPKIQADFGKESNDEKTKRLNRRKLVEDVFLQSWRAYKEHAWGHDEFSPLTKAFKDHFGGWGATLIDNLDTLLIMGMHDEFQHAIEQVKKIDFSVTHMSTINVFETTIRYLGGLISAHELADGKDGGVCLQKAKELAEMLYHAFDTPNRMPLTRWTWQR
jgi:mannosyl-oligosaccharide alpha-1,2-mannosidase